MLYDSWFDHTKQFVLASFRHSIDLPELSTDAISFGDDSFYYTYTLSSTSSILFVILRDRC